MTASQIIAALEPPARAFKRAQDKGYVWMGEQGSFQTCEEWGLPPAPKEINPAQLRLA